MSITLLRDKRQTTKLLILLEITRAGHHSMSTLAETLDITVQGVSDYIRIMEGEGLVRKSRTGGLKATNKGVLFMHQNLSGIREFVDDQMDRLNIIDLTTAIAGNRIRAGDRVGLYMEDGHLFAYRNKQSPSIGIAITNADKGRDVGVKELEGIIALKLGRLSLLQLPPVQEGGSGAVKPASVKAAVKKAKATRMGAMGPVAVVMAREAGIRLDMEFAVPQAAVEACQRGHNVLLLVGQQHVHEVVSAVESFNSQVEDKIKYTVETAGIKKG